jgi:predicted metal-dependent enzyme (double-stranded beta helix superfamily)
VHPQGLDSIVSLVWMPGQSTPIHDHRCWCVVGVLDGREQESRYTLHQQDGEEWLVEGRGAYYTPGDVCVLVPPVEDIHRVGNADERPTISMHIYGANIAEVGTSINRRFDLPIRESSESDAKSRVSWRQHDDHFLTRTAMNRK